MEKSAVQNQIRTISCREKEITDKKEINTEVFKFSKALFEPKINVSNTLIQDYVNGIDTLKLVKEQSQRCEGVITEGNYWKLWKKYFTLL